MSIDFSCGEISLDVIKSYQALKIQNLLLKYPEDKIMVIDKSITNVINYALPLTEFKKFGVKEIFHTKSFTKHSNKYYIYLIPPNKESISFIYNNKNFLMDHCNKHIICFFGIRDIGVESSLNNSYIWDYVTIEELNIDIVPVEYDCMNMHISKSMIKIFCEKDMRIMRKITKSIEFIQRIYGPINDIVSVGNLSKEIKEMILIDNKINNYGKQSLIKRMVLFDRTVDTITPCLSQLIYEGMIDDFFGIENGSTVIDDKKIPLNSTYEFYQIVRNKHINVFNNFLKSQIECSNIDINVKNMFNGKMDQEVTQFVLDTAKKRKAINEYLAMHIAIKKELYAEINDNFNKNTMTIEQLILTAQENEGMFRNLFGNEISATENKIFNFIEESMEDNNLDDIIAILSLYLQIHGKNNEKTTALIDKLMGKYNCGHIMKNLAKLGLLGNKQITIDDKTMAFRKCVLKYELINDIDINKFDQDNLCHLYGGFAPISGNIIKDKKSEKGITLVCFIGGCNYTEIAACRSLGNIIVLTTNIFNKESFFNQFG